jgi:hypothetical protein
MASQPYDAVPAHWSRFVHLLVNVPRRFELERPGLRGIARQGTMAHVLFVAASGRPRLSVPVSSVPEFRRGLLAELLENGELLRCTSERGSAQVAPVMLLDAVRQLPRDLRDRLLSADAVSAAFREWLPSARAPRPLTEVASDVLAHASEAGTLAVTAEQLGAVAEAFGLTHIAALVRGAVGARCSPPRPGPAVRMEDSLRPRLPDGELAPPPSLLDGR